MKRKLSFLERKLKDTISEPLSVDPSTLEGFLLTEISEGKFDNKNCKKGRKRNYN